MNKFKPLLIITTLSILQSCSHQSQKGFYKGYQLPAYEVTKKTDNIELRRYEKTLVAEVEVSGARKDGAKKGFRILAGYIFGKNTAEQKVAMTSPVTQKEASEKIAMTTPVTQVIADDRNIEEEKLWLVQFGMPKEYTIKTLPKPKDERIKFKTIPARKTLAITFSGSWSDKNFVENKAKLRKFAKENKIKLKGDAILAYYDDPFTFPWNRRNEIIWEIK